MSLMNQRNVGTYLTQPGGNQLTFGAGGGKVKMVLFKFFH
jgi:hypothetical protein